MDRAQGLELQGWLTELADGDRTAFHPVFQRLWPLVRGFVARQCSAADADDVAQQALLRVFERAGEFDPRLDAVSWVLGVAAYEVRSARRKTTRRREDLGAVEVLHALPDGHPTPEDAAARSQLLSAAAAVMGELRPADVETLLAAARGERSIASGATFRKRVERALTRFRAAWRTKHGS